MSRIESISITEDEISYTDRCGELRDHLDDLVESLNVYDDQQIEKLSKASSSIGGFVKIEFDRKLGRIVSIYKKYGTDNEESKRISDQTC